MDGTKAELKPCIFLAAGVAWEWNLSVLELRASPNALRTLPRRRWGGGGQRQKKKVCWPGWSIYLCLIVFACFVQCCPSKSIGLIDAHSITNETLQHLKSSLCCASVQQNFPFLFCVYNLEEVLQWMFRTFSCGNQICNLLHKVLSKRSWTTSRLSRKSSDCISMMSQKKGMQISGQV